MTILLTGGTGFIGSHTAVELLNAGHDVIIVDDLSNSRADVISKINIITGHMPKFHHVHAADGAALETVFAENYIDAVIHFAGFKAVGESVQKPLEYYRNNIDATLTLLETMNRHNVNRIVFSSSATVYGPENAVPYSEDMPTGACTNPYGWTKYMIEQILRDMATSNPDRSVVLLRYFNPIGAHESGLIGERPNGTPNNLMPYITQVAAGILQELNIFGNDYPTPDGTGVRDYIHVVDLAKGHTAALEYAREHKGTEAINLGTGKGYSVLDVIKTFEKVNGLKIPFNIVPRRPGDIAECYADTVKAKKLLHWTSEKSLEEMCKDSWRWQQECDKA